MNDGGLAAARALLAGLRRLAVLSGAGMSAESGVPTFRDAQTGLWSRFDPMQLASPEGFRADPPLVWRWYAWRRELVARAKPNAGHLALAEAAERFEALKIVTQNVDGLHQDAGSRDVIAIHGNILRSRCLNECGVRYDRQIREDFIAKSVIQLNDNVWTTRSTDPRTYGAEVVKATLDSEMFRKPTEPPARWHFKPSNPYDLITGAIEVEEWGFVTMNNHTVLLVFLLAFVPVYLYRAVGRIRNRKRVNA